MLKTNTIQLNTTTFRTIHTYIIEFWEKLMEIGI